MDKAITHATHNMQFDTTLPHGKLGKCLSNASPELLRFKLRVLQRMHASHCRGGVTSTHILRHTLRLWLWSWGVSGGPVPGGLACGLSLVVLYRGNRAMITSLGCTAMGALFKRDGLGWLNA